MSSITFRDEVSSAVVRGTERAYGQQLTLKLPQSVIWEPMASDKIQDPIARYFPPDWRKYSGRHGYAADVAYYLERPSIFGAGEPLKIGDKTIWGTALLANTAMRLGGDAVKLLVRLHMSCEIHAWVDGPNRAWLASVIDKGTDIGVLREGMGWDEVQKLLGERDDLPVVTSYSVCDGFPNRTAAGWAGPDGMSPEDAAEAWYDLPEKTRWAIGMARLRQLEEQNQGIYLELRPDNWNLYYYGEDITIMDLNQAEIRERYPRKDATK
jgi:hypothetical protein